MKSSALLGISKRKNFQVPTQKQKLCKFYYFKRPKSYCGNPLLAELRYNLNYLVDSTSVSICHKLFGPFG